MARRRASPAWLASVTGRVLRRRCRESLPLDDRDTCAFPWPGDDLKFANEPPGTAQAQAEPSPCSVAIAQRHLNVGDTRPVVLEGQPQPAPRPFCQRLQQEGAPAAMYQRIPCQFAGGSHDLGLIDQAEA